MFRFKCLISVFIIHWTLSAISGQQYEYKCKVLSDLNQTLCDANQTEFNITLEFERLSQTLDDDQKVMQILEIRGAEIKEIQENAFADLAFESVKIFDASYLSLIHTNAFSDKMVAHMTHQFMVDYPSDLINQPPDHDLYRALNSLKNLAYIQISLREDEFHEIPDNAFSEKQDNLNYLVFDARFITHDTGYGISRIGSKSFQGLSHLTALSFRHAYVQKMSADSFYMSEPSDERLNINLEDCLLFNETIEDNSFVGSKRPVTINLGTVEPRI